MFKLIALNKISFIINAFFIFYFYSDENANFFLIPYNDKWVGDLYQEMSFFGLSSSSFSFFYFDKKQESIVYRREELQKGTRDRSKQRQKKEKRNKKKPPKTMHLAKLWHNELKGGG